MPQWMVDLFGASLAPIVWVALVAAMVCVLAVVVILLSKRLLANGTALGPRTRAPRLQVVDVIRVDDKRKLVLVRRDDVEHLVLVGGQTDILVEASISRSPASPREVRSEDGRLDIPAISPGSPSPGRREPAAPPLTATRQDETVAPTRAAAGNGERATANRWHQPAPSTEPPSPPADVVPQRAAPAARSSAETVTPADRRAPDVHPAAFSTGEAGRRDGEGKTGGGRAKPVDQRQSGFVPAVETPLKPTEPPALNPSTMAFSRATPTIRSKADVEPVDSAESSAKPLPTVMPPQAEIIPDFAPPATSSVAPASRPVPPRREDGIGAQSSSEDRKAEPGVLPTGLTARRDVPVDTPAVRQPAKPAGATPSEESRPLSVRSFASAIQSRRYSRPETTARASLGTSSKSTTAPRATDSQSTAASRDAGRQAAGQSIEDFLSADLSEELTRDLEAAMAEPAAPPATPARPAPKAASGTASTSNMAIEAATSDSKPAALGEASSKEGTAGETTPDKSTAWRPAPPSRSADEKVPSEDAAVLVPSSKAQSSKDEPASDADDQPASPSTTALAERKPAAIPAPAPARPAAAPAQPTPAAARAAPAAPKPAPAPAQPTPAQPTPAQPTPAQSAPAAASAASTDAASPTGIRQTAAEQAPPAAATARPQRPTRPAQEIDLEEEMKRLLGELDIEGPSEQRKA